MPRQQAEQLLAGVAGGPGHGDTSGALSFHVSNFSGLHNSMHWKEYLYTLLSIESTKIDE
jgi:hypothetical protein